MEIRYRLKTKSRTITLIGDDVLRKLSIIVTDKEGKESPQVLEFYMEDFYEDRDTPLLFLEALETAGLGSLEVHDTLEYDEDPDVSDDDEEGYNDGVS